MTCEPVTLSGYISLLVPQPGALWEKSLDSQGPLLSRMARCHFPSTDHVEDRELAREQDQPGQPLQPGCPESGGSSPVAQLEDLITEEMSSILLKGL